MPKQDFYQDCYSKGRVLRSKHLNFYFYFLYKEETSKYYELNKHTTNNSTASNRLVLKELSRLFIALITFGTATGNRFRAIEQKC